MTSRPSGDVVGNHGRDADAEVDVPTFGDVGGSALRHLGTGERLEGGGSGFRHGSFPVSEAGGIAVWNVQHTVHEDAGGDNVVGIDAAEFADVLRLHQ